MGNKENFDFLARFHFQATNCLMFHYFTSLEWNLSSIYFSRLKLRHFVQKTIPHSPLLCWLASLPIQSLLMEDPSVSSSSPSRVWPRLLDPLGCLLSFACNRRRILCKSSSWATTCGLFARCHLWILFNGPTLVEGISLIRLGWTPSMKWVIAIASTNRIQREGRYFSLSNIKKFLPRFVVAVNIDGKFPTRTPLGQDCTKYRNSETHRVFVRSVLFIKSQICIPTLPRCVESWSPLNLRPIILHWGNGRLGT